MQKMTKIFLAGLCLFVTQTVFASVHAEETAVYQMERQHLLNPKPEVIQKEQQSHRVHIYEGMKLSDVQHAMDTQFDRIDNMMFILTRLPPTAAGEEARVEQDGCD